MVLEYKSHAPLRIRTSYRGGTLCSATPSPGSRSSSPITTVSELSTDSGLVSDFEASPSSLRLESDSDSDSERFGHLILEDLTYENWTPNRREYVSICPTPPPPPPPTFRDVSSAPERPREVNPIAPERPREGGAPERRIKHVVRELEDRVNSLRSESSLSSEISSINVSILRRSKVPRHEFLQYFAEHRLRHPASKLRTRSTDPSREPRTKDAVGRTDRSKDGRRDRSREWRTDGSREGRTKDVEVDGPLRSAHPVGPGGRVRSNERMWTEDQTRLWDKEVKGRTIRSARGTVRGVRNLVRTGIANFLLEQNIKDIRERESGRLIVYVTSCGIIRETRTRCTTVCKILRNMMIRYEERDVFMSRDNLLELMDRLGVPPPLPLPLVFLHGHLLGDSGLVEKLNETGELKHIVKDFKDPAVWREVCCKCGGYSMVPCPVCSGSKKSGHRNFSQVILRCTNCDAAGLVRCDQC